MNKSLFAINRFVKSPAALIISSLFLSASASAQALTAVDCSALIDKAFDVTGTRQVVNQMPQFANQSANNARSWGADPAVVAGMRRIMEPGAVLRGLKRPFEQNCDPQMLQDVIASMDTPLASRMREVELRERNPKSRQERATIKT